MTLRWDKPKKVRSSEDHAETFVADGAPPGTYVPNMSSEDRASWKAKLVGVRSNFPHVEIRKDSMVLIVSLHGWYKYKYYKPQDTQGVNVHIASAGPIMWTFGEWKECQFAVEEARRVSEEWHEKHDPEQTWEDED